MQTRYSSCLFVFCLIGYKSNTFFNNNINLYCFFFKNISKVKFFLFFIFCFDFLNKFASYLRGSDNNIMISKIFKE